MLVDDDDKVLAGLRRMLRDTFEVVTASTLEAASELAYAQRFDAVVSDFHLTDASGLDVLAEIQRLQPSAVRILYTGDAAEAPIVRDSLANQLLADVLQKPVSKAVMVETLDRLIGKQRK
ncbi:MAG: response regulator [Deltaproteobacteria bacterium]|nr:response regulator [Deltaproteobacteria bacterium]